MSIIEDMIMSCCGAPTSEGPEKFEEYDWDELPVDAKDAAKTLGYNKKTWDNDKDPETFGYDWAELDDEQKKAAVVIGYDEVTWDKE